MSVLPDATARPGLRERKKARTRAAIREHALRLFREQGYDATTVEQIAEAAEVSPSTFFRYFPTKEDVVLQDDLDLVWMDAFRAQPRDLGPIAAMRAAVRAAFPDLAADDLEQLREAMDLAVAVPAVRARMLEEMARTAGTATASSMASRSCSRSPGARPAKAARTAVRMAAMGPRSGGWARKASIQTRSRSSCRTTSSLVGK